MRQVRFTNRQVILLSIPGQLTDLVGEGMPSPYKCRAYRFATTVPLFFQMCRSGMVPRTQEVG